MAPTFTSPGSTAKISVCSSPTSRSREFIRTPAWVSNTELLYTVRGRSDAGRADFRIERMDIASGKSSRFIDWGVDPAISKDRQKVVWDQIDPDSQRETLTVAGLDLNDKTALVTPTSKLALFTSQVFSPDGKQVAFAAVDISSISPAGAFPAPAVAPPSRLTPSPKMSGS